MQPTQVYADIVKFEKDENGDLVVTGKAAGPELDIDKQICDPNWLKTAMPAWMEWGNVREQHSKVAAGLGIELEDQGEGNWGLKSVVIDPITARKVEKGVLKGYSIGIKGPRIQKDAAAPGGRIIGGEIVEVSLVDRPANATCLVDIAKSATGTADLEPCDAVYTEAEALELASLRVSGRIDKATGADAVKCPTCDGKGSIMEGNRECPDCHGDKKVSPETADKLKSKAADPDATKKDYSDDERSSMADKGQAMPGGGFPIKTVADLKNAIQAIGRAKNPAAAKAHIKKRAAALDQTDLIPDTWKLVVADLEKASDDTWIHDPATLTAVRDSLAQLMQAELDELMKGECEIGDLYNLLSSLQTFMCWWGDEADNGEDPQPYTSPEGAQDMPSFISLGVNPDIVKAAEADDATEEAKEAFRAEAVKALGLDKFATPETVKGLLDERFGALEEQIKRLGAAAAPGGPVTTRTGG